MRPKTYDLLLQALVNHAVPAHKHLPILNDVFGPRAVASHEKRHDATEIGWNLLRSKLSYDRRTLVSNRRKWPPALVPVYESYISIMDKVRVRIDAAALTQTREQVTRAATIENRNRAARGERPGPSNGAQWQTWVPPHVRQQLIDEVERIYALSDRGQGNRWIPFASTVYRREMKQRLERLRQSIADVRRVCATPDTHSSPHLYGALLLAGVRMAEIELNRRERGYKAGTVDPFMEPVPVHWAHLCSPEMRKRLRDAHADPSSVTPEGLGSFHNPINLLPNDSTGHVTQALADLPPEGDIE